MYMHNSLELRLSLDQEKARDPRLDLTDYLALRQILDTLGHDPNIIHQPNMSLDPETGKYQD